MNDENPKPSIWYPILVFFESVQIRLGKTIGSMAEFMEWGFGTFIDSLSAPWRYLWRYLAQSRIAKLTQETTRYIAKKSDDWLFWHRDFLAERVFPKRLLLRLDWLAKQTELFLFELDEFGSKWFFSRDFRKLIWAAPAALLSAPLAITLVLGLLYSPAQKIRHYEVARFQAIEANDHQRAQFLLARLSQLGYRREKQAQFASAMALVKDEKEQAVTTIRELAPESEPGFAPAHLWLAAAILDGELDVKQPWTQIETHANHARQLEPQNPLAKRFLVECKMQQGKIDDAVTQMEELNEVFPDLNAELAHQFAKRGDLDKARECALDAVKFHQQFLKGQQSEQTAEQKNANGFNTLTIRGYQRVAEAYRLVGQDDEEIAMLHQAMQAYPESDAARQMLIQRLTQLTSDFRLSSTQQKSYLRELLHVDPLNEASLKRIVAMVRENGDREQAFLQSLADDPDTPPTLTKAMGDVHLALEQYEPARKLYELTCERNDKMAYSWNNLAWINSNVEPINLNKALELTDRALAAKQDANFYETRGQILVKMERWDEAIQNLEQALRRAVPNPENAHRSLAMIYDELKKPEQAAAHRALADR